MTVDHVKVGSFTAFFHRVEPRLRRGLVATLGLEVGGEATAEAMAYAWGHWDRVKRLENPAGYLYRVGCRSRLRTRPSRWLFPEVEEDRWPWVEPGLPAALRRLSRAQRTVAVLLHCFDWSQAEVTELLGVARGSVQTHDERALGKLRRALAGDTVSDLLRQLHGYGEQLEARMGVLEVEDVRFVRVGAGPVPAIVVAALAVVVLAALLWPGRGSGPAPFVDEGTTVPTTVASPSTTATRAPAALAFGLDGLAAFRAGPVPAEAACPPGSTPDTPGDPTAPRPPVSLDESGTSAAFDRESGLLVLSVEGSTWTFDPCWNRWEAMWSQGPVLDGRPIIYDADSDLIVASDPVGEVWGYDVDTDTWRPAGRKVDAEPSSTTTLRSCHLQQRASSLGVRHRQRHAGIPRPVLATHLLVTPDRHL
jgi:RNA polymerase sigma-70 factor (ECF subfamily)